MYKVKAPQFRHTNYEFVRRMRYAKQAIRDPFFKILYRMLHKPGYSLFEIALLDSMMAPNIVAVGWKHYTGQQNDEIPIVVFDDTAVASVQITIYDRNGDLIETGYALPTDRFQDWVYTVLKENRAIEGCRIVVEAMDWPCNKTTKSYRIPL